MPYLFDPNNDICLALLNTDTSLWACKSRNPTIDTLNGLYGFTIP